MLRRLVLAPAMAFLAVGTAVTPADAGRLCVDIIITEQFDLPLPEFVPATPKTACVPVPFDPPPGLPPIG